MNPLDPSWIEKISPALLLKILSLGKFEEDEFTQEHPFVVYWSKDGEEFHKSFCVISDSTKHNSATVHAFLQRLVPEIKQQVPELIRIH